MKYQILFLSSWFPSKLHQAKGNFVQRHAEAVAKQHNVEVLYAVGDEAQKENFMITEEVINSVRIVTVYYKKTKSPVFNLLKRMIALKKGFKIVTKPNLVHANVLYNTMLFAVYLKLKYQIPFVVSEHWSVFLPINHHKLTSINRFVAKLIAKNAEMLLPVSKELQKGLTILDVDRPTTVIGNVVNCELFQIGETKPKSVTTFLHLSNQAPLKNTDKIVLAAIELYKYNPNFELHIGGANQAEINDLISKYNAHSYIKTFGIVPHQQVAQKMQEIDCFILFSDYETQSCVVLEAFATGKPVITTAVGGLKDIVDPSRAIIVEKQNQTHLMNAMLQIMNKEVEFTSAEEIRQFVVENFSKKVVAKQFSDVYQQVLAK